MIIKLTKHAEKQIRVRKISVDEIIECLSKPDEIFYDVKEKTFISTKQLNRKILIVIYTLEGEIPKVVTAFRTDRLNMIYNRVKSGRWVKL